DTVVRSIPSRLNDDPAAAHARKAKANSTKAMESTRLDLLPIPRVRWITAKNAKTAAVTQANPGAEKVRSMSWPASPSRKVASPSDPIAKKNATSAARIR